MLPARLAIDLPPGFAEAFGSLAELRKFGVALGHCLFLSLLTNEEQQEPTGCAVYLAAAEHTLRRLSPRSAQSWGERTRLLVRKTPKVQMANKIREAKFPGSVRLTQPETQARP